MKVGDMVISSDALQHDVDVTGRGFGPGEIPFMKTSIFKADPELVAMAEKTCKIINPEIGCYVGRVVTGDQFISDAVKRNELITTFGAYCVEMEGAAMAQVAWLNKVPFVIIRAISDKADTEARTRVEAFEDKAIIHLLKLLAAMFIQMGRK
jgi:adenosylhomocysteine nucleosidase